MKKYYKHSGEFKKTEHKKLGEYSEDKRYWHKISTIDRIGSEIERFHGMYLDGRLTLEETVDELRSTIKDRMGLSTEESLKLTLLKAVANRATVKKLEQYLKEAMNEFEIEIRIPTPLKASRVRKAFILEKTVKEIIKGKKDGRF